MTTVNTTLTFLVGEFHKIFDKEQTNNKDNNLLKEEFNKNFYSFNYFPAIEINKQLFLGNWESQNVLRAVCSGFNTVPKKCYDENMIIEKPVQNSKIFFIILIVLIIIAVNAVVYCLCKFYVKKNAEKKLVNEEFDNKVSMVVSNYLKMKDTE